MNPLQFASDLKLRAAQMAADVQRLEVEETRREMDTVQHYAPMPSQDEFHRCPAKVRIIRAGNQSGKSHAVMMEVARAARKMDPYGKYPTNRPLVIWIMVFQESNIGRTVFRMLFELGCGHEVFLIRDKETEQWRTWNPSNPEDLARESEKVIAPPMIPPEEIEGGQPGMDARRCSGFAWAKQRSRIFKNCRLKNGTTIWCFCTKSDPPMGDAIDLAVIDEDLSQDHKTVSELMARVSKRSGRIIWSVWPQMKNDALEKLCREAEDQEGTDEPDIVQLRMRYRDNEYITPKDRKTTLRLWASQGENILKSRDEGDFLLDSFQMYPEFDLDIHGIPNVADPKCIDKSQYWEKIDWWLRTREVPADWTRFLWIDPGWGTTAVLALAVPPPELGDYVVAYGELYLHAHTVPRVADAIVAKFGKERFYLFGIDWHQARKHTQASSKTYAQQFAEEFRKRDFHSVTTGYSFRKGSDDVQGRCAMVRTWLGQRADAAPKFRILRSKLNDRRSALPHMEQEFRLYRRMIHMDMAKEDPVKEHDHIMNCQEYCAHDPLTRYHRLPAAPAEADPVVAEFQRWRGAIEGTNKGSVNLGPGATWDQPNKVFR